MNKPSWDTYFMNMVYLVASRSSDPSTKVGAVIVKPDMSVVSTGYNGFPTDVQNTSKRWERPLKYSFVSHAEMNAVVLAARNGHSTNGCIMYTNGIPCTMCTRVIIQGGIGEVLYDSDWMNNLHDNEFKSWSDEAKISVEMFNDAMVRLRGINYKPMHIYKYKGSKIYRRVCEGGVEGG